MKLLKRLGLAVAAVAFCLSFSVDTTYAQPGKARWSGNSGKHKGWTQGQRRGWNKGRKTGWRNYDDYWRDRRYRNGSYRYGRLTPWEYRRLQRQRGRIYRTDDRYYRDGYRTRRETRRYDRYDRRDNRYDRRIYRDRRYW